MTTRKTERDSGRWLKQAFIRPLFCFCRFAAKRPAGRPWGCKLAEGEAGGAFLTAAVTPGLLRCGAAAPPVVRGGRARALRLSRSGALRSARFPQGTTVACFQRKEPACCPAPPAGRGALRGAAFLQTNLFREQLMPRSFALQGKAKLSLSSTALSRTIFFPRFLFPRSRPPNGPLPGDCRADG